MHIANKHILSYILTTTLFAHVLPIPEILKAILALPAVLVIPIYIGKAVLHVLLNKMERDWNYTPRIIIAWLVGFIFITYSFTIYYLLGFSIQSYTFLLYIIFIIISVKYEHTFAFGCKDLFKSNCNVLIIPLIGLVFACFFILSAPFPLSLDLDMFRHNLLMLNLIENNHLVGLRGYFPSFHIFFSVISITYNLNTLSLFWSNIPLLYVVYAIGIYLFSSRLSNNRKIAIMVTIFAVAATWTKTIALHRVIPQTILYVLIPYYLYLINEEFERLRVINLRVIAKLCIITFVSALFIYFVMPMNFIYDDAYYGIAGRSLLFTIFLCMLFIFSKTKFEYIFSILVIASLLIHLPMGFVTISILLAYIIISYICINYPNLNKYMQISILLGLILIILEISSIFQYSEYLQLSNLFVDPYKYTSGDKINILMQIFSIPAIILTLIGLSTIKKHNDVSIIAISASTVFIVIILFTSVDSISRILILLVPFFAYLAAIGLENILNMNWLYGKKAPRLLIITLLLFMLFTPTFNIFADVLSMSDSNHISTFEHYEYDTGIWIKNNLEDDVIILSDPMTQLIIGGISKKQTFSDAASKADIKTNIRGFFTAKNAQESMHFIKMLALNRTKLENTMYFKTYFDTLNKENSSKVIVVISGRTERWIKEGMGESNYNFWGTNQFPQKLTDSNILTKFSNETYFKSIYINDEKIYVYRIITDDYRY